MKSIREAELGGKKVFLRVDYNVPMEDGKILDANRITKSLATVKYLLEHKAKIIIATHFGKPKGKIDPETSTVPLAQELARQLRHQVQATDYLIHPEVSDMISKMQSGDILMLGNLRWNEGEEANDPAFAQSLADYADIYVNDAFGASHRAHASIVGLSKYLPSYAGFLLESEVTTLSLLLQNPARPFVLVMGGAKIEDKAPMIENLSGKVDKILVGGGIANTFLASTGINVSESLYEEEMKSKCQEIMKNLGEKLILPSDQIRENLGENKFTILDIGPEARKAFDKEIESAKTVFWNGNMGKSEDEEYAGGTKSVAEAIARNGGTTVVAGGDTVGFVQIHKLEEKYSFISTGGGAALEFLSGNKLPGVEALEQSESK